MKFRLIKPIVTGAAMLTLLCSCNANKIVSLKEFVKIVTQEKNFRKYVVYDKCTFKGSCVNSDPTRRKKFDNFVVEMKYDPKNGYTYESHQGGDKEEADDAIRVFLVDVSIPGIIFYYGIDDEQCFPESKLDVMGRFVETKINPCSLKGIFLNQYYYDVKYDEFGMPYKFRVELDITGDVEKYFDFTVTHSGDSHEVMPS